MMSFDVGVALVNDGSKTENQALYFESHLFVDALVTQDMRSSFQLVAMPLSIEAGGKGQSRVKCCSFLDAASVESPSSSTESLVLLFNCKLPSSAHVPLLSSGRPHSARHSRCYIVNVYVACLHDLKMPPQRARMLPSHRLSVGRGWRAAAVGAGA